MFLEASVGFLSARLLQIAQIEFEVTPMIGRDENGHIDVLTGCVAFHNASTAKSSTIFMRTRQPRLIAVAANAAFSPRYEPLVLQKHKKLNEKQNEKNTKIISESDVPFRDFTGTFVN